MKYNFFTNHLADKRLHNISLNGHLQEISVIGRYKTSDIKIQLAAEGNGTINVSLFLKFKEWW